jgi:hypothetical protein
MKLLFSLAMAKDFRINATKALRYADECAHEFPRQSFDLQFGFRSLGDCPVTDEWLSGSSLFEIEGSRLYWSGEVKHDLSRL